MPIAPARPIRQSPARLFGTATAVALAAAALFAAAKPASAQFTTYSSRAEFLAAIAPGAYDEDFAAAFVSAAPSGSVLASPAAFSGGAFGFQAIAANDLYVLADPSSVGVYGLSTFVSGDTITLDFTSSPTPVTAFGGFFFLTSVAESPVVGGLSLRAETASGLFTDETFSYAEAPASYAGARFFGFTTGNSPLAQVTLTAGGSEYVSMANVTVGAAAAAVPEPGTAALLGAPLGTAVLALAALRTLPRRRSRRAG